MKRRNRSPELKGQKFKEIIHIGKLELLAEDVFESKHSVTPPRARKMSFSGFNMQDVADKVGMTRTNLYRYVESKRELWFAILQDFIKEYNIEVDHLISLHEGSSISLIEKLLIHYITFGSDDSHLMQKMIFLNPPQPKYEEGVPFMGPIEVSYSQLGDAFPKIRGVIKQAVESYELKPVNVQFFMQYFWGIIQGMILVIEDMERDPTGTDENKQNFQQYITQQIQSILKFYST